jgi:hypothetical protein
MDIGYIVSDTMEEVSASIPQITSVNELNYLFIVLLFFLIPVLVYSLRGGNLKEGFALSLFGSTTLISFIFSPVALYFYYVLLLKPVRQCKS